MTETPPITAVASPTAVETVPEEEKSTKGRGHKKRKECPKCHREYDPRAGVGAVKMHEDNCKGVPDQVQVLFTPGPKQEKEVKRPPKKQLYYCPGCQSRFYDGTVYCPGCGEEIEWA